MNNNGNGNGRDEKDQITNNHRITICADELKGLYGKYFLFNNPNLTEVEVIPLAERKIRVETTKSALELYMDDWFSIRQRTGQMYLHPGPSRYENPFLKVTSRSVVERKRVFTHFNDPFTPLPNQAAVCFDHSRPEGFKWVAFPGLIKKGDGRLYPNTILGQELIISISSNPPYQRARIKPRVEGIFVRSFCNKEAISALEQILIKNELMWPDERSGAFLNPRQSTQAEDVEGVGV